VNTDSDRFIADYIEVSANGEQLGTVALNPYGFTGSYDLMEMFVDGTVVDVRKCSYNEFLAAPPTLCSTTRWR
jgi:hypothetical protein